MSRHICRATLVKYFKHLIPFFDVLYKKPTTIWAVNADGSPEQFIQVKGYVQGCPLSGTFSALVLSELLKELGSRHACIVKSRIYHFDDGSTM
eukprot:4823738-Ditylum_brightwellii.AAC.1